MIRGWILKLHLVNFKTSWKRTRAGWGAVTQAALPLLRQLSGPEKLHRVRRLLHVLEQTLGMYVCSPPCVHVDGGEVLGFTCVCMFYVSVCVSTVCVCMCFSHRSVLDVSLPQSLSTLVFEAEFSLSLELTDLARLAGWWVLGIICLYLHWWVTGVCWRAWLLYRCWKCQLMSPCLQDKDFTNCTTSIAWV